MRTRSAELPASAWTRSSEPLPAANEFPRLVAASEPLGASERLFAAQHRFTATNVTRVIAVEGELPPHVVATALRALSRRHPRLGARIVSEGKPHFVYGDAAPPRLVVHLRRDDEHWRAVLERLLNERLDHDGPLLVVHYLRCERTARAEILVVADHAICDGVSMNRLCAELLESCVSGTPRAPRPRVPVLDALLPSFSVSARAASFARVGARFARVSLSRALHEPRISAHRSGYAYAELAPDHTEELIARARSRGTTLSGALLAAVALGVREQRASTPRLALSVPINLRPRIRKHALGSEDLGNYTSAAYLESTASGYFWPLARELKQQLDRTAASDEVLACVPLLYGCARALARPDSVPLAHAMVSNSGTVPVGVDYGAFRTLGFYSATSAPMVAADFCFFCNTHAGRLCLNLVYPIELATRSEAEQLLARVRERLLDA